MAPQTLSKSDSSRNWTNSHADNLRIVRDKLVELNPGYNVFIYWVHYGSIPSDQLRPDEWVAGTFCSKPSSGWYSYTYSYYVFAEGILTWSGSEAFVAYPDISSC